MALNSENTSHQKRLALHRKYAEAVDLYANTGMTLKAIAERCGVTVGGLGIYLRRHQRELVLKRHQIPTEGKDPQAIRIIERGKQSPVAHAKYRDAIVACDSMNCIDMNISQVARLYQLDGTALANYMRIHYPEILEWREKVRMRLGIHDHLFRGARPECTAQYAEAVELYRTTDMTLPEVADACHVSERGLNQHLRFYHKDLLKQKEEQRRQAQEEKSKERGHLSGNGRKHNPTPETEEKYTAALTLYRETALTMKEIVERTGVPAEGFRFYLHKWHKDLVLERSGVTEDMDCPSDLRKARKRMKTVAAKYAAAIESLKQNPRPLAKVATEFGFNPETFRNYLHKHEPELVERHRRLLANLKRK